MISTTMKLRIINITLSILYFVVAVKYALFGSGFTELPQLDLILAVYNLTISFSLLRKLRWSIYIIHFNSFLAIVFATIFTINLGAEFLIHFVPTIIVLLATSIYIHMRRASLIRSPNIKKEFFFYFSYIMCYIVVSVVLGFFTEPVLHTLQGPVSIKP